MLPSAISGYAVTFFLSAALYLLLATNSAFVAVGPTVTLHSDVNFPTVTFTVASPSPFAVIVPFSFTVNTCSSLDSHLAVVSSVVSSGLILSSRVSDVLFLISNVSGIEIDTICIGSVTVTLHVAVFPLAVVVVIFAVPTDFPVTNPFLSTAAIFPLLLVHITLSLVNAES